MKKNIFLVLLGLIVGITGTVIASNYLASQIVYNDTTVDQALNELYTVHETYKNLTTDTTVTPETLLNGITAYNKNGELVTGNSTNCISNTFVMQSSCTTSNGCKLLDFEPSIFILYTTTSSGYSEGNIYYYNTSVSSSNFVTSYDDGIDGIYRVGSKTNRFTFNNSFYLHNLGDSYVGKTMYYVACK